MDFSSSLCVFISTYTRGQCVFSECVCVCVSRGLCGCCGSQLESIQLTDEEYQTLKDSVMTDIIQGRDVFNKTTPEVSV